MNDDSLRKNFSAFVAKCQSMLESLGATHTSLRVLLGRRERIRWLTEQAEHTKEFAAFARSLPPPRDEIVAGLPGMNDEDFEYHRWFLRNAGFYHHLVADGAPQLDGLVERWSSQRWGSRRLYLLRGLTLAGHPVVTAGDVCIRRMAEEDLHEYFGNDVRGVFANEVDLRGLRDRTFLDVKTPSADLQHFYWGPDRTHPWIAFVNLAVTFNVAVSAGYDRPLFDLWPADCMERDVKDLWVIEPDRTDNWARTVDSAALQTSLADCERGWRAAETHRVEVALKWFTRACRSLSFNSSECDAVPVADTVPGADDSYAHPDDLEALERGVVELSTALEAVYLDDDVRQKTSRLTSRCAALLSDCDEDLPALQESLRHAYGIRSRIVHGDRPPGHATLVGYANFLRHTTRRSLVALLRMGGDQRRLTAGVSDATIRRENRRVVPA